MTPENVAHCPSCKRDVLTFSQTSSTMPQDETNKIRKYIGIFCTQCGVSIERKIEDYENGKLMEQQPEDGNGKEPS
ncbi:hypothetical protein LCGC14_1123970 [marine sediment metagenome]|uniref:Uncharacterized protein n=1 Tax=marine sediment metagenome TaxID=412755 RepID=A0A0F9M381_9ZZZZ